MANWEGVARTNYFTPLDLGKLEALAQQASFVVYPSIVASAPKVALGSTEGGWPSMIYDEEKDEERDFSFEKDIMPLVAEGEVVILQEAGYEGQRYVTGNAVAFQRQGDLVRSVQVNIDDIYKLAAENFCVSVEEISKAVY